MAPRLATTVKALGLLLLLAVASAEPSAIQSELGRVGGCLSVWGRAGGAPLHNAVLCCASHQLRALTPLSAACAPRHHAGRKLLAAATATANANAANGGIANANSNALATGNGVAQANSNAAAIGNGAVANAQSNAAALGNGVAVANAQAAAQATGEREEGAGSGRRAQLLVHAHAFFLLAPPLPLADPACHLLPSPASPRQRRRCG